MAFTNTIIYNQAVGVQNLGGNPTFNHTLRYQVNTPTLGTVSDLFAKTGDPAFTADGYHLTQQSAAIDAGIATSVTDDVDSNVRPQGLAPDIGAVESPYTQNIPVRRACEQTSRDAPLDFAVGPRYHKGTSLVLQQDYLIQFSYGAAQHPADHFLSRSRKTFPALCSWAARKLACHDFSPEPAAS